MKKLNSSEEKCLNVLVNASRLPEECILYYSEISKRAKLSILKTKRAVRSLARKGLAKHSVAWSDEGVAGSGYMAVFK